MRSTIFMNCTTMRLDDAPDTSENEEFSDALVDVIDLIRNSSIGELELKEEDDYDDEEEEE